MVAERCGMPGATMSITINRINGHHVRVASGRTADVLDWRIAFLG